MLAQNSVLLIEDNHDLRVTQRQILEEKGLDVYTATNGRDALQLLKNGLKPKVIILDLKMPIMDGDEFLKQVEHHELCSEAQILIVSGSVPANEMPNDCVYFPKPYRQEDFTQILSRLIRL